MRAQKLFRTSSSYFLLLLLHLFLCNNCRCRWGRYFWDLEGEEIWVRFFWAKGLGGSWFLFFSWRGGGGGGGVLGVLRGGNDLEWEMWKTGWGGLTGCIMHRVHISGNYLRWDVESLQRCSYKWQPKKGLGLHVVNLLIIIFKNAKNDKVFIYFSFSRKITKLWDFNMLNTKLTCP